ncbi:hypothetical protein QBC40DRAFT_284653 [Triangularia verruculosa]|uniref:Azaphilone pigments biosynthesis cluster protein L N-terminal domain-containing protein n=1 Tax=Triangularia verruculosa TaxID=2587418 RepID=A0AAN6XCD0_9PEZI|nr:hypothetical protein QBC40DRAFT_284653 [Triangularia verruculosa]
MMAEPIGVIASALTIAEVAASSAKALWGFINGLRKAPAQLQALKEDILSAQSVLEGLRAAIRETSADTCNQAILATLFQRFGIEAAIKANQRIILDFTATIEKYTVHSTKGGSVSIRDRLKVTFRKSKLEAFKARLNASKNTISYALIGATLASSVLAAEDVKNNLLAHQEVLEEHSRQLNDILEYTNDLDVEQTEDPEEDNIPITAIERDLTLEVLPILQHTTTQMQQAIDSQISGTFQDIETLVADTNSRALAGTIGQNIDPTILRQRVGRAEAKNSSRVFIGKMSEGVSKDFWGHDQVWTTGSPGA